MGTAMMLYVLPMMLGQSYDLGKEKPGLQIFPVSVLNNAVQIEHYFTDSQYRMVDNAAEVKDFLDISGKLSLKIKGGMVDISGEGKYLKDSSSKTNGLEILVKVHFETVTKTIPSSIKPNADWTTNPKEYLGTHYCRSITYGGDLVASIRITADNTYDLQRIKGAINGAINTGGGSFEANLKGKLEMLKQNAQDSSSIEINYYASVPIKEVTHDIDGLMKLIDDFPNQVKKVNKGVGNPLRMELYPLNSLEQGYHAYLENRALTDQLEDLESHFDDLRETRRRASLWIRSLPPITPDSVDDKIKIFLDKVNEVYGVYLRTIGDLDVASGTSDQPLNEAFDAYRDGDYTIPQKYIRGLTALQKEIYEEHPELKPRRGGAHYTRWGSDKCSAIETETTLSGVVATSESTQNGGSSELVCAPPEPVEVNPDNYFSGYTGDDLEDHLLVSPVRYRGGLENLNIMKDKPVACARCRAKSRTTVFVMIADKSCPSDKWTKEYDGILMAPGRKSSKGEYICMELGMKQPTGKIKFGNSDASSQSDVQEVSVECGSLPCKPYASNKAIPCAVCTI